MKSWVAADMGLALASGRPFLGFQPPRAYRVLLVDAEMSKSEGELRIARLVGEKCKNRICSEGGGFMHLAVAGHYSSGSMPLNLADHSTQDSVRQTLQALYNGQVDDRLKQVLGSFIPEVIILDNVGSLFLGIEENSNSDWLSKVNRFTQGLRDLPLGSQRGVSVILVHHTGKTNHHTPRGGAAAEQPLDWSASIVPQKEDPSVAMFKFEKQRQRRIEPGQFKIHLEDVQGKLVSGLPPIRLTRSEHFPADMRRLLGLVDVHSPRSVRQLESICEEVGFPGKSSKVGGLLKKAKELTYIDDLGRGKAYILTAQGKALL